MPEPTHADDIVGGGRVSPQVETEATIPVEHEMIIRALEEFRLFCEDTQQKGESVSDSRLWQEKLREILGAPEFDSLHARGVFEANIVYQLANGWQPGHEILFVAAVNVFRWREEPNRLRAFGEGGAVIDLAVLQYLMFEDLRGSPEYAHFRQAVARLRTRKPPAIGELVTIYPYIEALAQHYPTWLSIITDVSSIETWQKKSKDVPVWRQKYSVQGVLKKILSAPKNMLHWHWSHKVYAFIVIVGVISGLSKPGSVPKAPPTSSNYSVYQVPVANESQPRIPSSAELVKQTNSSHRTSGPEILEVRAIYPRQSLLKNEEGQVIVRVLINELGKADSAQITQSSGFPLLDDAALDAAKNGSFKPYMESGKAVSSFATLPISFSLTDRRK